MEIDIQGHRGCRGNFPENTIEGFLAAIEMGVHTLEMDVTISKDLEVIVSHDPFFSHLFCLAPEGKEILKTEEEKLRLYELNYEEIKAFDSGSKGNVKFPDQKKMRTHKPSLQDVVKAVNGHLTSSNKTIRYNIEIKRRPEWDTVFHPEYQKFADLVIHKIKDLNILEQTTVQCFDVGTLQYINKKYPSVQLVYLIQNLKPFSFNMKKLGFIPAVYSPYYKLVKKGTVKKCKNRNMKLIPWTVNKEMDMKKMIDLGVDGIITDYPKRLIQILKDR